jgi:ankyrin repeat protein
MDLKNNKAEDCHKALNGNRPLPLDIRNKASQNALMIACAHGSQDVVEMLFTTAGTHDLEAVDAQGWTALHYASYNGHQEILHILCENRANPSATTNNNETGLHLAAQVKYLKQPAPAELAEQVKQPEYAEQTEQATQLGKQDVVVLLLKLKCPLDIQTTSPHQRYGGDTALHLALCKYEEISLLLLQHGADVTLKDKNGRSALHFASASGMSNAVKKLIQLGADVNIQDSKYDLI